jgi:hypothetical protein
MGIESFKVLVDMFGEDDIIIFKDEVNTFLLKQFFVLTVFAG